MKIPASVRTIYAERRPVYEKLKDEVDRRLSGFKDERWHYESRIKEEESFALKVETGRVPDPRKMEDFFAATYVVPTLAAISEAERVVKDNFTVQERRPPSNARTHKRPDSFPFDDLRLYAVISEDDRYPSTGMEGIRFELQIKTFLQHAWSIATHDLIYKSEGASWPQERIAFQVKAMLEHAELSIEEAAALSRSATIAKSDKRIKEIGEYIKLIVKVWKEDKPKDTKRLATNVYELCSAVGIKRSDCEKALQDYANDRGGGLPQNISPYLVIVEALFAKQRAKMDAYVSVRPAKYDKKILLTNEVSLPEGVDPAHMPRAIIL